MVFSSLPFLFLFLTVVLLVSHLLPFKFRNFFLLLANLVFYAYGEPVYVLIMIASILVNFFAGVLMDKQPTQSRRRAVLVVGIVLNIILPGKADFDAWDGGLAAEAEADDVPLPLEAEVTNLPIREQRRG